VHAFYATTIPGLEPVVADELTERLPGIEGIRVQRGSRQGRVSFSYQRSPRRLLEVRSARGLYAQLAVIDKVTVGRPGLERIAAALAELSLAAAGRLLIALQPDADPSSFQLSATVQGPHRFTAADLARVADEALCRSGERHRRPVAAAMHLQLQVEGRRAHLGLRLPNAAAREGEPLAYCLGRLSGLGSEDAVLVARGGRRWLGELATAFEPRLLLGFGEERTRPARAAIPAEVREILAQGEHLPLQDGAMSSVLGLAGDPRLAEVREYLRCLVEGGMAALVVNDAKRLLTMLRQHEVPVSVLAALPIRLNGRDRTVFLLGLGEDDHQDGAAESGLLQIDAASS
jgi:hypothetical protein